MGGRTQSLRLQTETEKLFCTNARRDGKDVLMGKRKRHETVVAVVKRLQNSYPRIQQQNSSGKHTPY